MRKQRSEYHPARRGSVIRPGWFAGVAGVMVFLFSTAVSVQGGNDLLHMPAEKTDRATYSILMDIVNVNGRLVAVGERGHILYSDDDGGSWTQADVPVSVTLTSVYFPTKKKGWAVGHDGVVLHTGDGGRSWQKQLDGDRINALMIAQMKQLIREKTERLKDTDSGLDDARKEDLALELETLDYFLSDLEMAVAEGPTRPLMDVWFNNEREGLVVGAFGMILSTSDGGGDWAPILDRIKNPDGYHYYGITRSGDDLFMAGEAGMLFRSGDHGRTWQRLPSPYEGSFFDIVGHPEGGFVTAFGLRGNLFYSRDRGKTWLPSNTGTNASLSGGAFLSNGSFFIAGVDGAILESPDRGKSFTALPVTFPGSVAMAQTRGGALVVVGLRGMTRIDVANPSCKG